MAYIYFERGFVPCGFLIVRDGVDPHREEPGDSVMVDTSQDITAVAADLGFVADYAEDAYDFLESRHGQSFAQLDEYLPEVR